MNVPQRAVRGILLHPRLYFLSGCCRRGRVAETPEELRKSGKRGSGRRRREERRVSEGRYGDFERSDEGDVKGLS